MTPDLKAIVEALLFAADEPLSLRDLAGMVEEASPAELRAALDAVRTECSCTGRGLEVGEIAGGYRLLTKPELAPWVSRLSGGPARQRLSRAALETLAIIAYKQPVTRIDLEEIRGVNVEGVLKTLVERDLVSIVGREEGLGRPLLYGTTDAFLVHFGLNSLADLPHMDELEIFLVQREGDAASEPAPDPQLGDETTTRPAV